MITSVRFDKTNVGGAMPAQEFREAGTSPRPGPSASPGRESTTCRRRIGVRRDQGVNEHELAAYARLGRLGELELMPLKRSKTGAGRQSGERESSPLLQPGSTGRPPTRRRPILDMQGAVGDPRARPNQRCQAADAEAELGVTGERTRAATFYSYVYTVQEEIDQPRSDAWGTPVRKGVRMKRIRSDVPPR